MRSHIYITHPAAGDSFPLLTCRSRNLVCSTMPVKGMAQAPLRTQILHRSTQPAHLRVLLEPVGDASAVQIVDGQLDRHFVARQDLDVVHAHLAGNMGQYLVPIFELHPKHSVR